MDSELARQLANHLAEEMAKVEIPEYHKRCALPQSVLEKLPLLQIPIEILLPLWEAMDNLRKQPRQLQMELSEYQEEWREFHEMTKHHDKRIQQIALSANPWIKVPFYETPSVERDLAKARKVVFDIEILREDTRYLLKELEEMSVEL
ncbi:MAG: hypothetical protein Q9198_003299 [Flavoplaca austrocitrina]